MTRSNEAWREDPDRRAQAHRYLVEVHERFVQVEELLNQASALVRETRGLTTKHTYSIDDRLERVSGHLHTAIRYAGDIVGWSDTDRDGGCETYIGNMAAFGEGIK